MGFGFLSSFHFWLLLADVLMGGIILTVQSVVYPAFPYYSEEDLRCWHRVYTRNIAFVVVPLMLTQLLGGVYWNTVESGFYPSLYLLIICILWAFTFLSFVPLHKRISAGNSDRATLRRLVRLNGARTVLWLIGLTLHLMALGDSPA